MKVVLKPFSEDIDSGRNIPNKIYDVQKVYKEEIVILDVATRKLYTVAKNRILKVLKD